MWYWLYHLKFTPFSVLQLVNLKSFGIWIYRWVNKVKGIKEGTFIHSAFCLTTGSKPPPKRFLHIVRSRASSFKWEYPVLSLRSSSSFLRLLVTSISPFIFPLITCFRRHFLHKMWPIQLAFCFQRRNTLMKYIQLVSLYILLLTYQDGNTDKSVCSTLHVRFLVF